MKEMDFFGQFSRIGIALAWLFIDAQVHAQSGGPVGPPTPAFTVNIITPTNDAVFLPGETVSIKATAVDYGGIVNTMFFYAGTNLLRAWVIDPLPGETNGTPLTLQYDWTNVPAGEYTLTVRAGDNHGTNVTSPPVNITVGGSPHKVFVTIVATDPIAVEPGTNHIVYPLAPTSFTNYISGTNTATFLVRRIDPAVLNGGSSNLTVYYTISGTASNGLDYATLPGSVTIPARSTHALITVSPLEDNDASNAPPYSTVILTLVPSPFASPFPSPYTIGWPSKAGALILEENLYPGGPPIGPIGPPIPVPPFHAKFPGTNGMLYCLQVSSNMIDWVPVCTNAVVKSSIQFVDPETDSNDRRYYRAVPATTAPVY